MGESEQEHKSRINYNRNHYQCIYISNITSQTRESDLNQYLGAKVIKYFWLDKKSCLALMESIKDTCKIVVNKEMATGIYHTSPFIDIIDTEIERKHRAKLLEIGNYQYNEDEIIDLTNYKPGFDYKLGISRFNPLIIIKPEKVHGITVNVIRDDYLISGTKQRAIIPILQSFAEDEFVYASPIYGFAQIALAYSTKYLKKRATIFVSKNDELHVFTKRAIEFDANIVEVNSKKLKDVQRAAKEYAEENKAKLIPFGLYFNDFVYVLREQIRIAVGDLKPKRLWLVIGSGTVFSALKDIWPDTYFLIVQVGKYVDERMLEGIHNTIYTAPETFEQQAVHPPPYASAPSYDAKIWQFVIKYGEDGDYIWNVAG